MKDMNCLRCGKPMHYIKREKIQLGETSWFLREVSNLMAGALEVDIHICPSCGKIEFYMPRVQEDVQDEVPQEWEDEFYMPELEEGELPQKQCPNCGNRHDFDYPKCPVCKYEYF